MRRLRNSGPERAAIEVDPTAGSLSVRGCADIAVATRHQLPSAHARTARLRVRLWPPADVIERLPPRRHVPHLANRWDQTLAAILVHRSETDFRPSSDPFGWALGPRPTDPTLTSRRSSVEKLIAALAVADGREVMQSHGWDDLPPWAEHIIRGQAQRGGLQTSRERLDSLLDEIAAYRSLLGLEDDYTGSLDDVLGPVPDDPRHRSIRHLLIQEVKEAATHERRVPSL